MTAPEKCPYCNGEGPDPYGHVGFIYPCGTIVWNDGKTFSGESCTRQRFAKCVAERDALRARVAELEARLAGSVEREVALHACSLLGVATWAVSTEVWENGWIRAQVGQFPREIDAACTDDVAWLNRAKLALARAEAEAAKPQTDKEKSDADQT